MRLTCVQLVQELSIPYTGYPDFVQFVSPAVPIQKTTNDESAAPTSNHGNSVVFVSRGTEREIIPPPAKGPKHPPNTVNIHRLSFPTETNPLFQIETLCSVSHDKYKANEWPVRMGLSSRYIAAPTAIGEVYVWNLPGQLVGVLHDHESM